MVCLPSANSVWSSLGRWSNGVHRGSLGAELIARGYRVRIVVRQESEEMQLLWPEIEVVIADALCEDQLERAMEGVHTAII